MQVGEIMSRRAGLIDPATTVAAAARRMRDDGVGCLLVGRSDRLLGIITDRDIVVRTLASSLHAMREPVRHVMSSEVLCCFADQPVEEAARIMAAHGVCRLPVLDRRESLVGIVSLSDLHGGVPKRKLYAVTFYKELADSCGTLHEVSSSHGPCCRDGQRAGGCGRSHDGLRARLGPGTVEGQAGRLQGRERVLSQAS